MGNIAVHLPAELLDPRAKFRVIEYIRELRLPSRFRRKLLQDWSTHTGGEVGAADYDAVTAPRSPGEGA
jgi:hypothetical protein